MERKELCIISDSDIPSGSGGINSEGYTYGQYAINRLLQRYYNVSPTLLHVKWQRIVMNATVKMDLQCIR